MCEKPKIYSQEELRKMSGLPKRSWRNYFGHPEPELPQPKTLPKPLTNIGVGEGDDNFFRVHEERMA